MDLGSIFILLALAILVSLFIARPLMQQRTTTLVTRAEHDLSALLAERDRVLTALQELDFDYTLQKIPEEDYPSQRAALLQKGAEILRELDSLQSRVAAKVEADPVESALSERRRARAAASSPKITSPATLSRPDDPLEAALAERRRTRAEKAAGFCSQCGNALFSSDRFCSRCGAKTA